MEQRNEPSTAEIVKDLRYCGGEASCVKCKYTNIDKHGGCYTALSKIAADRLEQLERENADLRQVIADGADFTLDASKGYRFAGVEMGEAMRMIKEYPALKSRAEKAEAERDAAIADIRRRCETCAHGQKGDPRCVIGANGKCYFGGYDYWEWRGQRGKENDGKD